jgi:hypothetical protein
LETVAMASDLFAAAVRAVCIVSAS